MRRIEKLDPECQRLIFASSSVSSLGALAARLLRVVGNSNRVELFAQRGTSSFRIEFRDSLKVDQTSLLIACTSGVLAVLSFVAEIVVRTPALTARVRRGKVLRAFSTDKNVYGMTQQQAITCSKIFKDMPARRAPPEKTFDDLTEAARLFALGDASDRRIRVVLLSNSSNRVEKSRTIAVDASGPAALVESCLGTRVKRVVRHEGYLVVVCDSHRHDESRMLAFSNRSGKRVKLDSVFVDGLVECFRATTNLRSSFPELIMWSENDFQQTSRRPVTDFLDLARALGYSRPNVFRGVKRNPKNTVSREELCSAHVIGQLHKRFVLALAKATGRLLCVDQHAASERINLERLIRKYSNTIPPQRQVHARLSLPPAERVELASLGDVVPNWGFEVESSSCITVTKIPVIEGTPLKPSDVLECRRSAAIGATPRVVRNILDSKACRTALTFNVELSDTQMARLLEELSRCENPFACAHGRPSVVSIASWKSSTFVHSELEVSEST